MKNRKNNVQVPQTAIQIDSLNVAVIGVQDFDGHKVALTPEEISSQRRKGKGSNPGNGHTGFAMACALTKAPFAVLRSAGNRKKMNKVLKPNLQNGGVLFLTGHGSEQAANIGGKYAHQLSLDQLQQLAEMQRKGKQVAFGDFNLQPGVDKVKRSPEQIAQAAVEAGLKSGDQITIILYICEGAKGNETGNSTAQQMARAFAKQGISTRIIASEKTVGRFGTEAIKDGQLSLVRPDRIKPGSIKTFITNVSKPTDEPTIKVQSTPMKIDLNAQGVQIRTEEDLEIQHQETPLNDPFAKLRKARLDNPLSRRHVELHQRPPEKSNSNSYRLQNPYLHKPSENSQGRKHFWNEVSTNNFVNLGLKNDYKNLAGDKLKYQILNNLKSKIEKTETIKELDELAEIIEGTKNTPPSEEYKILQTARGFYTWFTGSKTDSVKAYEEMIKEQKKYLINFNPRSTSNP